MPRRPRLLAAAEEWAVWPYLLLSLSQFCFGSNQVMGRMVEGVVPPVGLSFWRWVFAVLILLPFTWRDLKGRGPVIRENFPILAALAFTLMMMGNTTIYVALNYTTAINAGVIAVAQPAVTFFLSWLIFRDRFTPGQAVGVAIAVTGVLTVLFKGKLTSLAELHFNAGDLWMLVSITGFSLYAILFRKVPKALSPMALLVVVEVIGLAMLLPVYLWESLSGHPMHLDWETAATIAWAAVVVAIFAMALWNIGIEAVGANKSSVFVYVRLLFLTVVAIILLGERLHLYHFAAFALIFAGLWLVSRARTAAP